MNNAIEIDVDALCDSEGSVVIAGLMEHVEPAGIHSGDSACALPPQTIDKTIIDEITLQTKKLAKSSDILYLLKSTLVLP